MRKFGLVALVFLVPFLAFGEVTDPVTEMEFWQKLLETIGGFKGATVVGAAYAIVQLIMYFFRSPFGNLAGSTKLLLVTGLNLVALVLGAKIAGLSMGEFITSAAFLVPASVFLNEVLKYAKVSEKITAVINWVLGLILPKAK